MCNGNCNECKICSSCTWEVVDKPKELYNLVCLKTSRDIAKSIHPNSQVNCPEWCPKYQTSDVPKHQTAYECWYNKEPKLTLNDIKCGGVYHIPPINGAKRKNIIVKAVYKDYFSYIEEGGVTQEYMYPSFMQFKYLVKIK